MEFWFTGAVYYIFVETIYGGGQREATGSAMLRLQDNLISSGKDYIKYINAVSTKTH